MGSPPKDRKIIQVRVLWLSEAAILFFSLFFFCSFFFLDLDALDLAPIGNVTLYLAITLSRSSKRCRTFKPTWDFIEWRCSALKLCKQLRPVFSLPLSVKRLLSCFSNLVTTALSLSWISFASFLQRLMTCCCHHGELACNPLGETFLHKQGCRIKDIGICSQAFQYLK